MLPTSRRLRAQEVRQVLKTGRQRRAAYLSMKYVISPSPLRAAAVVSKAVAKRATERNRLRRALYRALQERHSTGMAVFFIQKVPPGPLKRAFAADLAALLRP